MKVLGVIVIIGLAVAGLVWFGDAPAVGGVVTGEVVRSMLYGLIAVTIFGSVAAHYRGRISAALLGAMAWLAIFGAAVVGYTYRYELSVVADRVMDEVAPGREAKGAPGEAAAVRGLNGHFAFAGITNGVKLNYLFDTGASTVTLRNEDAARIGVKVEALDYSITVSTANGQTVAAPATIDALTIGGITQRRVRAFVARPGALRENLLGMSFLERLKGYSVEGGRLVLRQ